ncbi:hypothetical protein [Enterococcus alishanensis]|uniref:hypothetical protein n=1 Tax=Enterococcus alishanensis TaxID=1303817 RepID=UPI003CCEA30F
MARLKWPIDGVAFKSVLSDHQDAISAYRLYNSNSEEHFYTLSKKEYDYVSSKGRTKNELFIYIT